MAKAKNPASFFLTIAVANGLATVCFIVFYFLHNNAGGGDRSMYLLLAAGAAALATVGALFAYNFFKRKFQGGM